MQVEITLEAPSGAGYSARDIGFLLGKHPDRLFEREISVGRITVFYTAAGERKTSAVLHLEMDPIDLARSANRNADGLLSQYVNDRPYVANSFLSVALARAYNQAMAGTSKERQSLADRALPLEALVTPVAAAGGSAVIESLFAPLGYAVTLTPLSDAGMYPLFALRIAGEVRLRDILRHLYVLIPVLDNRKHYWVAGDEVDKLLEKGKGWLADHPAKELIARRALKHERKLTNAALARLDESGAAAGSAESPPPDREETLEQPIRLHELRYETVVRTLREQGVSSILDLGCGDGRLIQRLAEEPWVKRIVGVDASVAAVERAARRLRLDLDASSAEERVAVQMGSLTYGDRRWRGFDAATLVEVIEHIEPSRLPALAEALFGRARPRLVAVTTPNREYNCRFPGLKPEAFRHADHRFEWTRAEFRSWGQGVAAKRGYSVEFQAVGPQSGEAGAPSQMAVFERSPAAEVAA